jgi:hypothetical protein
MPPGESASGAVEPARPGDSYGRWRRRRGLRVDAAGWITPDEVDEASAVAVIGDDRVNDDDAPIRVLVGPSHHFGYVGGSGQQVRVLLVTDLLRRGIRKLICEVRPEVDLIRRRGKTPACIRLAAVELWGGRTPIYVKPRSGRDFMVILFKQPSDAARLTRLEARSGLGTARHGSLVLLYYRLSARIARLRAAVAASG